MLTCDAVPDAAVMTVSGDKCAPVHVQVVTGIGKHSVGRQPRILPAVVDALRDSNLRFWSQPDNAGVIEVLISGHDHGSPGP